MNSSSSRFRTIIIITATLHFTILIYGIVVLLLSLAGPSTIGHFDPVVYEWGFSLMMPPEREFLPFVFMAVSVPLTGLSIFAPKIMKVGLKKLPQPLLFDFKNLTHEQLSLSIMRMAMAEAIAIFGLILTLLSNSYVWILGFGGYGLVLQFFVGVFGGLLLKSLRSKEEDSPYMV